MNSDIKLVFDVNYEKTYENILNSLQKIINSVSKELPKIKLDTNIDSTALKNIQKSINKNTTQGTTDAKQTLSLYNQIVKAQRNAQKLNNSKLTNSYANLVSRFSDNGKTLINETSFNSAVKGFTRLKNKATVAESAMKKVSNGKTLNNLSAQYSNLTNKIEYYLNQNKKIKSDSTLYNSFKDLQSQLGNGNIDLSLARKQFHDLQVSAKETGLEVQSVGEMLKETFSARIRNFAASMTSVMFQTFFNQIKESILEVDSAMTELKKVTDETDASYSKFLKTASNQATETGSSVSDTINATADFARLGYNMDEATQLSKAATIYKNVGDGISDISEASESIISTMKAFDIDANDSMSIIDEFNEVGNNYAISSEGIGEALQRSAAALATSGNTLEESIGLVTGMNTVVQNPETVGTALKTLTSYLRVAKTEAEAAGEDTSGMASSVSSLRTSILQLTKNKVDIMSDSENFKSTYQIMKEISKVWSSMAEVDQASLLDLIAGKRNANVVTSLITNFSDAEAAMESASNSTNSALNENETYLDSIEGKTTQLKASVETLATDLVSSNLVKGIVGAGTKIINFLDTIIDKFGILLTLGGTGALGKIVTSFKDYQNIAEASNALGEIVNFSGAEVLKDISKRDTYDGLKTLYDLSIGVDGLKRTQATSALFKKGISEEWRNYILNNRGEITSLKEITDDLWANIVGSMPEGSNQSQLSKLWGVKINQSGKVESGAISFSLLEQATAEGLLSEEMAAKIAKEQLGIKVDKKYLAGVIDSSNATDEFKNSVSGAGKSFLNFFTTSIGKITAVVTAITIAVKVIDTIAERATSMSEAVENFDNSQSELSEIKSDLESVNSEIDELEAKKKTVIDPNDQAALDKQIESLEQRKKLLETKKETANASNKNNADDIIGAGQSKSVYSGAVYADSANGELSKAQNFFYSLLETSSGSTGEIEQLKYSSTGYIEHIQNILKDGSILAESDTIIDNIQANLEEIQTNYSKILEDESLIGTKAYDTASEISSNINDLLQQLNYVEAVKNTLREYGYKDGNEYLEFDDIEKKVRATVNDINKYNKVKEQLIQSLYTGENETLTPEIVQEAFGEDTEFDSAVLERYTEALQQAAEANYEYSQAAKEAAKADEMKTIASSISPEKIAKKLLDINEEQEKEREEFSNWLNDLSKENYGENSELVMASLVLNTDETWDSIDNLENRLKDFVDFETGELTDAGTIMVNKLKSDYELVSEGISNAQSAAESFRDTIKNISDVDDSFNSYTEALEILQEAEENGVWGTKEVATAADYIFGDNWDNDMNFDERAEYIKENMDKITKLFGTYTDSNGDEQLTYGYGFLEQFKSLINSDAFKGIDGFSSWFKDDVWHIDPSDMGIVAKEMGITEDAAWSCLNALQGITEVDMFDSASFSRLLTNLQETEDYEGIWTEVNGNQFLDLNKLQEWCEAYSVSISEMEDELKTLKDAGIITLEFDVDNYETTMSSINSLQKAFGNIYQKQNDGSININLGNLNEALLQVGKTKEETAEIITALDGLQNLEGSNIKLTLPKNEKGEAYGSITEYIQTLNPEAESVTDQLASAKEKAQELDAVTLQTIQTQMGNLSTQTGRVKSNLTSMQTLLSSMTSQDYVINTILKQTKSSNNGNNSGTNSGTSPNWKIGNLHGTAHAKGSWGAKSSYSSLMGEAAPEIWVHSDSGMWELVDHPQFGDVKRGDIIFNGSQTKELLKNGNTPKFGRSYVLGKDPGSSPDSDSDSGSDSGSDSNSSSSSNKSEKAIEKFQKWVDKLFDWIEVRLDRLSSKLDKYEKKAEVKVNYGNYGKNGGSKNNSTGAYQQYYKAMYTTGDLISNNKKGATRYKKQANQILSKAKSSGLISSKQMKTIKTKVANGTIDISKYGEKMQEVIKEYQNWYEKAEECSKNVLDYLDQYAEFAETMYNLPIDKSEAKIEKINSAQEVAEAKLSTMIGATNKNNVISQQNAYAKKENTAYQQAAKETSSALAKSKTKIDSTKDSALKGLSKKDKQKIINAAKNGEEIDYSSYTKLSDKGKKAIIEYNAALKANEQAQNDAAKASYEYTATIRQNALAMFENIATDYENVQSEIEHRNSLLSSDISKLEAQGYIINETFYNTQKEINEREKASLENELAALTEQQKQVEMGTDEWWDMQSTINDVSESIAECTATTEELNKSIRELEYQKFEDTLEQITRITDEYEFLITLMDSDNFYDDNGKVTSEGKAAYSSYLSNMQIKQQQADMSGQKAQEYLSQWYVTGSDEYLEKYNEAIDAQQSYLKGVKDEKDAIVDLVEEGIEKQLDALSELIDKRKEALESEKELYNYQKEIKEKTDNLSSIEKQLSAYSGDDSEENQAKLQELKNSYNEAKEDLNDTEYEKYLSDQEEILDDLYDKYEEILNSRLDNVDTLISAVSAGIANASDEIRGTIDNYASAYGYNPGTDLQTIVNQGASGNSIITAINNAINTISTAYSAAAASTTTSVATAPAASVSAVSTTGVATNTNGIIDTGDWVKLTSNANLHVSSAQGSNHIDETEKGKKDWKVANMTGGGVQGADKSFNIVAVDPNGYYKYYVVSGGGKYSGWITEGGIDKQRSSYATGTKSVKQNEFAWTQENGSEVIIRKSDGAMLTPLSRGDMVFDHEASLNLWKLANGVGRHTTSDLSVFNKLNNGATNNIESNVSMEINLPNVKNYSEFKQELVSDKQFEKAIQSMTLGKLNNTNGFSKYKY